MTLSKMRIQLGQEIEDILRHFPEKRFIELCKMFEELHGALKWKEDLAAKGLTPDQVSSTVKSSVAILLYLFADDYGKTFFDIAKRHRGFEKRFMQVAEEELKEIEKAKKEKENE